MTSECKPAADGTMEAFRDREAATEQKIFGRLFLRRREKNVDTFQSILWSE